MVKKKGRKRKKSRSIRFFILYSLVSSLAFLASGYLFFQSTLSEPVVPYSGSKECRVYDENGSLAAYADVTLETNSSFLQSHFPINVTLEVDILVPQGQWIYAVLEGATAAFPDKEPSDWNHSVEYVIVLKSHDYAWKHTWSGSRIMNYTFGQDWDAFLHITNETFFITHNIPEDFNIGGVSLEIYTIPNAVHIASDEYVAEIERQKESKLFDLRVKGVLALVPAFGFLVAAIKEIYDRA